MKSRLTAILDFGSSQITAICGERGVNGTFAIKGMLSAPYEGFYDGEFLDEAELETVISQVVSDLQTDCSIKFDRIYVGVPGAFVSVVCKEKIIAYPRKRKITQADIDELFAAGLKLKNQSYRIINSSAVYFTTDDVLRVVDPIGLLSGKLGGLISYSLMSVSFERRIRAILGKLEIREVNFVSSMYAECMYLFEPQERDNFAMLLDVGHLTSVFAIVRGDGILYQKTLPFGGGYITADLSEYLKTDYDIADLLKRKINISQEASGAKYEVVVDDEAFEFSVEESNDIVTNNLDNLCEMIEECLAKCNVRYPDYLVLHITGGGVLLMRGCREYIANRISRVCERSAPNLPLMSSPEDSSRLGLLDYALDQEDKKPRGLLQKIFGRR